jgi:hypothetical protein
MDEWLDTTTDGWYKLLSVAGNIALWAFQGSSTGDISQIDADVGIVTPVAGVVNALGGTGANTVGSGNTLTINITGGGYKWQVITAATKQILVNEAYFANNAGTLIFTLPSVANVGDGFRISGMLGNWQINQNAGQSIRVGNIVSTIGVAGSVASTMLGDSIHVICKVANTGWQVVDAPVGVLIVT